MRLLAFARFTGIALFVSLLVVSLAQAQGERITGTGAVSNVRDVHAYVRSQQGETLVLDHNEERIHGGAIVQGIPAPQVRVVGQIDPSALRQGLLVRVGGKLRAGRQFIEPITAITITGTQIDPQGSYGVFPDDSTSLSDEERAQNVAGVIASGQIVQLRGTRIAIAVPNPEGGQPIRLEATVSPQVTVEVDSTDFRTVRTGDSVEFEGIRMEGNHVFVLSATYTKPQREPEHDPSDAERQAPPPPSDPAVGRPGIAPGEAEPAEEPNPSRAGRILRVN